MHRWRCKGSRRTPQLSSPSTLWLRSFFSRFSFPPRLRSDCARSSAASALLPVDALSAHVLQPLQLSSPSTLWLRTFVSRSSSHPRLRSECARSSAASALLLVDALMRTFCNRLSSPPHRRSDCARSAAASTLLHIVCRVWIKLFNLRVGLVYYKTTTTNREKRWLW